MKRSKYIAIMGLMMILACNNDSQVISNNIAFKDKLSDYGLFKTALVPAEGVTIIEIASTLFTDYAEKQRLLKLPAGQKVVIHGDSLPIFPDGTIIAKTFYYTKDTSRQIIETRLLMLKNNKWNAATYRWNEDQKDATLWNDGAVVPVTLAKNRTIAYKIPAQADCASCHRSGTNLSPIGPKAANLNMTVYRDGIKQNQLAYLMNKGIFEHAEISSISALPDYNDSSRSITARARAYLDINCAHCHSPSGLAANTSLKLGYTMPYDQTGIEYNKQNMIIRMTTMGEFHMPKIGTTIIHDEGLLLVKQYIKSLKAN